jgi:hypothetical protein
MAAQTHISMPLKKGLMAAINDQLVRVESSYVGNGNGEAYLIPVAEFLSEHRWFAERGLMCPETLVENLDGNLLAGLCEAAGTDDSAPNVLVHLGYPGATSPIHFDWDFRSVLHVNLSGQKLFAIAHPNGGLSMPTLINSIPFDLSNLSVRKQRSLLHLIDAETHSLGGGEGVRFPPLWWHAAIYRKPSLSLSFRFDEVRDLRPIAALPRSAELQRLAWLIYSHREQVSIDIIGRVVDAFLATCGSWRTRHRRFLAAVQQIENECRLELGLAAAKHGYPPHLLGIPAHVQAEMKRAYSLPSASQPSVPSSSAEIEMIRSYLFEVGDAGLPEAQQVALAGYARAVRMSRRT